MAYQPTEPINRELTLIDGSELPLSSYRLYFDSTRAFDEEDRIFVINAICRPIVVSHCPQDSSDSANHFILDYLFTREKRSFRGNQAVAYAANLSPIYEKTRRNIDEIVSKAQEHLAATSRNS